MSLFRMNWQDFFGENYSDPSKVVNADIGCGYGGLLFKLSEVFPEEFSVGFEIRDKVSTIRKCFDYAYCCFNLFVCLGKQVCPRQDQSPKTQRTR